MEQNLSQVGSHSRRRRSRHAHGSGSDKRTWSVVEKYSGLLFCALAIATPWMYGTTETWSVALMNAVTIGAAVVSAPLSLMKTRSRPFAFSDGARWVQRAFLSINILLLAWCAVAMWNARASFSIADRAFTYYSNVISWLPTSYDRPRTGQFLLNSVAWFALFWSLILWVRNGWREHPDSPPSNRRITTILWVIAANGFLLAIEGILQRLSGTSKLLWIRDSYWGEPEACFGPFSYRGNAGDYLNLIWPTTLGLWFLIRGRRRINLQYKGDGPELMLIPMFLLTCAGAFITLSRGSAIVAAVMLLTVTSIEVFLARSKAAKIGFLTACLAILALVAYVSSGALAERFKLLGTDELGGRTEIYRNAQQIAADFPLFGSGPGSFLAIYQMYRSSTKEMWQAFLHDDWLETRVTFGWLGLSLVVVQFGLLFAWVFANRRQWLSRPLTYCLLLSLAGCLLHAKGDFPFQTYSIVFTFVLLAAILVASSTAPLRTAAEPALNTPTPENR